MAKPKKKAPPAPAAAAPRNPAGAKLGAEVSTVNSYLYLTRPYPYNPDDIVGKKGIKKYTEMTRDEQIKAAMMAKQYAVIAPGWEVQPARFEKDGEKKDAEDIAKFIEQNFNDMTGSFDTKLIEMLTALTYGYSIAEKVFWLIDYSDYKGKVGLKDLKFRNPEGFDFHTDPFGNLYPQGVLQAQRPLPAEKFLIYTYRKKFSNYYGDSDLRECYRPWWAKDNIIKFMMITLERYGEPTWVFNAAGGLSMENKSLLENFMRDIQSKSGLILPDTITAKPESPQANAGSTYIPVLEYLDGLIRASLGLPNLIGASTTESQTGSLARSETQMDMWTTIMEYLRHDVEANIDEQIIKPLIDWNYDITDGKYPTFRFKALSEEEKKAQFDTYINGMNAKAITKTREDEEFFRERLELPALPDDYPVAGEITPEMQAQTDQQGQEMHDATMANMQAKAEAGGAGTPAPAGKKPSAAEKSDNKKPFEEPQPVKAADDLVPLPSILDLNLFETEPEKHLREYQNWKDKQLLQDHLINHVRNRDLTGEEARHVGTYMNGNVITQYLDVPGVDAMHEEMGMIPNLDTEPAKYADERGKLFAKQPTRRIELGNLMLTQAYVHKGRVEDMTHDAETLNAPVQVIKHGLQHYLMDGHHRAIARHVAGKKLIRAKVYEHKQYLETRARRRVAKDNYVPSNRRKGSVARGYESEIAQLIGGECSNGNAAFDVTKGKHCVEIKTIIGGRNPKITMHPTSLQRKLDHALENGLEPHTIAIDARNISNPVYYYRKGIGSFRLSNMERVPRQELGRYFE